jgi:ABC-type nitrate/sulfonate/bicarbonate transport system permease component
MNEAQTTNYRDMFIGAVIGTVLGISIGILFSVII